MPRDRDKTFPLPRDAAVAAPVTPQYRCPQEQSAGIPGVASITIADDTVGSPHQLGLNGIGLTSGANATLSAPSLTFVGQAVGTTSAAQTLTLTNYGTATLNIAVIAATGDFPETDTCGASLATKDQ